MKVKSLTMKKKREGRKIKNWKIMIAMKRRGKKRSNRESMEIEGDRKKKKKKKSKHSESSDREDETDKGKRENERREDKTMDGINKLPKVKMKLVVQEIETLIDKMKEIALMIWKVVMTWIRHYVINWNMKKK